MNKICFIMPLHPPHFSRGVEFLRSFVEFGFKNQADLVLVFSSYEDSFKFERECAASGFKGSFKGSFKGGFSGNFADGGGGL